ncbi:DUF6445 family protein [Inhella proteolytica]|uniref:Uncharacterized protein n=1 Tax=Inhella proteolytica TaxID=2795029 RepID=A0A931J332_9BURK|nr:DUF6445 family protein [Inhella proteolytica]MBH9575310.1 hypothetical protein [Inhella proteolytica]
MLPLPRPASGSFFNPQAQVRRVPIGDGQQALVIDDALAEPGALVNWVDDHVFEPAEDNAYPGQLMLAPPALTESLDGLFMQKVRSALGGRRTVERYARFSLVTQPPQALRPCQWLCHRDRVAADPGRVLFAASVLYLFPDPRLGGTRFFRPRCSAAELERLLADAQELDGPDFQARYGIAPGYMGEGNAYFECTAEVEAAWNRLVFYDGAVFHSAVIERPDLLSEDAGQGRLTLNGFYACTRALA